MSDSLWSIGRLLGVALDLGIASLMLGCCVAVLIRTSFDPRGRVLAAACGGFGLVLIVKYVNRVQLDPMLITGVRLAILVIGLAFPYGIWLLGKIMKEGTSNGN